MVNRGVFTKLVLAGLFDDFNMTIPDMLKEYWSVKKIKDDIPEDVLNLNKIGVFIHKAQLNLLMTDKLSHVVSDSLPNWIPTKNAAIPYVLRDTNHFMIADVATAVKYIEKRDPKRADQLVYMVALYKGSSVETTKTGKKLLKISLQDGSSTFDAVDWNNPVPPRFPINTPVLIHGKIKRGYKVPVEINITFKGSIEKLT
jgi:hypothetical protein